MNYRTRQRRNGKPASCEPCRKDKVRCDHAPPPCARCKQRGIVDGCFYHPAPLTQAWPGPGPRSSTARVATPDSASDRYLRSVRSNSDPLVFPSEPQSTALQGTALDRPSQPGYLGPTSFMVNFTEDIASPALGEDQQRQLVGLDSGVHRPILTQHLIHQAIDALTNLVEVPTIAELIQEYYAVSQSAVIAAPLIIRPLAEIRAVWDELSSRDSLENSVAEFSLLILQNTARSLPTAFPRDGSQFHKLFTGRCIRMEIVAVMFAIAGRASSFGLAHGRFSGEKQSELRARFARKMLEACDTTLQVCRTITTVNDLTVWLLHETLLLCGLIYGDLGAATWARLGDLSTSIFELGLHHEPHQSSDLPLYLLESRRRLFAAAYQLDKSITTFLGRPPRISWRHSHCRLPLDIDDEAIIGDQALTQETENDLDGEGWNIHGLYQRSSWIRLRFLINTFREEILELSLRHPTRETADDLRDTSRRCQQVWNSLPSHLRYDPGRWDANLPVGISSMLVVSYLAYLYNEFLVQRLLVQQNPDSNAALLEISSTVLSTVLVLGSQRGNVADLQPDYTRTVLLYGLSSAIVLAKALQHQARTGEPLVYKGSRPALIRELCVFISHLEWVGRPGDINFSLFVRANNLLSDILDEVLEPRTEMHFPTSDISPAAFGSGIHGTADEVNLLDTTDFEVFNQWLF